MIESGRLLHEAIGMTHFKFTKQSNIELTLTAATPFWLLPRRRLTTAKWLSEKNAWELFAKHGVRAGNAIIRSSPLESADSTVKWRERLGHSPRNSDRNQLHLETRQHGEQQHGCSEHLTGELPLLFEGIIYLEPKYLTDVIDQNPPVPTGCTLLSSKLFGRTHIFPSRILIKRPATLYSWSKLTPLKFHSSHIPSF